MNFKLTLLEKIMIVGLISLFIIFSLRECSHRNHENNLVSDISSYRDSAKFYQIKVDGMKVDVAYNKSLALYNKDQLLALLKKNDTLSKLISKFKDIKSITIINNNTTILGDTIRMKGDSIPCDFKAFKVRRDSAYYHFVGTIAPKYFSIDSLNIPNKQSIVIGKKKLGFLKGIEERVEIINSNPLIKTYKIENYIINNKKKRFGIGVSVGYGLQLSPIRFSPYVGGSINYNIISF